MSYEELQVKKEDKLTKGLRVSSDYHADALKRKDRQLFDNMAIRKDLTDISEVLGQEDLNLTEEERSRLEMVRGRNLSSLLILSEKTTGDSKEMKAVKKSVAAIEGKLNEESPAPFTEESIDEVLKLYDKAILACRDYMMDKNPSYSTGKERYRIVSMNIHRLHEEAEALLTAKELLRTGVFDGQTSNARELLVLSKIYSLGEAVRSGDQEEKRNRPTEDEINKSGREAGILYQALSGKETPSDLIARLSKSKSKTERKLAKELPALFANIQSSLNDFREGKVTSKVFLFGNDVLSLYQNAFGQLTLRAGGQSLTLERNTGTMADILARDIVKNEEVYGKNTADRVIREVAGEVGVSMEDTANRQILTDYLSGQTGYKSTAFSNFFTNDLACMVRGLLQGKKIVIVREDEATGEYSENEMVFTEWGKQLINVAEPRELLKKTRAQENREKVKSQVTMQKKEVGLEEARNQEEKKEEKEEGEWSEKEEKIKNLLGDMVFSYETWIADEKLNAPGKRMKLMLEKNSEAVAYLISDMFLKGTLNHKMVNGMIDRMPLFVMSDEEIAKFRKSVTDGLNKAAEAIKKMVDERIREELGDRPDNFLMGLAYDGKRFLADGAAGLHLASPDSLMKGIEIRGTDGETIIKVDGLRDIIKSLDEDTVQLLGDAESSIDAGVEEVSAAIQENIKSYTGELFKGTKEEEEAKLPDPYERGIEENEKKRRLRERIAKGNEKLNKMTKDSIQSGDSGLGLFTKLVFEQYFKGVDTIDKRSMLASMIKNAKPVGKLLDVNGKDIDPEDPSLSTQELKERLKDADMDTGEQEKLKNEVARREQEKKKGPRKRKAVRNITRR